MTINPQPNLLNTCNNSPIPTTTHKLQNKTKERVKSRAEEEEKSERSERNES